MNTPSLVGMGIGFAVIGLIFGLLMHFKPDMAPFKKYTEKQFGRTQGMLTIFFVIGLLLIYEGLVVLPNALPEDNPAASLMGIGAGLAVVCLVFGLLSIYKPEMRIFRGAAGKKLYQTQGVLMTACGGGLVFFIIGLMGKPWAV